MTSVNEMGHYVDSYGTNGRAKITEKMGLYSESSLRLNTVIH